MMIDFLINVLAFILFAFIGSLVMCGWYKTTRDKMIFQSWSKFWEQRKPESTDENIVFKYGLAKPLSACVYCYASVYGTIIFWLGGYAIVEYTGMLVSFSWQLLVLWVMYMLCCVSLNGIIIKKVL